MAILTSTSILTQFERNGYALIRNPFSNGQIDKLTSAIEKFREEKTSAMSAGFRNLLKQCSEVREFANSKEIREIVIALQGEKSKPVRSIFFDKTPASNWYVTWHQDLSIAIEKRIDTEGFGPWTIKDGTTHTQPPEEILEQIVSLRIHLDACPKENGAIKFVAGSHKNGILDPADVPNIIESSTVNCCEAEKGDVILMRPLILHSSSKSTSPDHRRVLHLEFSSIQLPNGLSWTEA